MKLFQKGVAVLLAIIISTQSTVIAYAETAEPTTVQTEDGVTFTHNSDGTVTATVYPKTEVRAMSAAPITNVLEDQGNSYARTGDNISLRLGKTYTDGEMLVSIESNGAGISFYPETNSGKQMETKTESSAPPVLVSEQENEQTENNESGIENTDEETAVPSVKEDAQPEAQEEAKEQPDYTPEQPTDDASSDPAAEAIASVSLLTNYNQPSKATASTLAYECTSSDRIAHLLSEGNITSSEDTTVTVPTDSPAPTETPAPAGTPVPTETPESTGTPVPTGTPAPMETSAPAETPAPTETPVPSPSPSAEPEKEASGKVHIYSSVDGIGCGGMGGGYSAVLYPGAINEYTDI